jgi:cobalt/nickel transport system permease protein
MAFPAALLGYLCRPFIDSPRRPVRAAAEFIAGAGAILLSGIMVALSLVLALGDSIDTAARLILIAHAPVMMIEGIITVFVVEFIRKIRPEML